MEEEEPRRRGTWREGGDKWRGRGVFRWWWRGGRWWWWWRRGRWCVRWKVPIPHLGNTEGGEGGVGSREMHCVLGRRNSEEG